LPHQALHRRGGCGIGGEEGLERELRHRNIDGRPEDLVVLMKASSPTSVRSCSGTATADPE